MEFTDRHAQLHVAALALFMAFSLGMLALRVHQRRDRPDPPGALKTIGTAKTLFREGDLERDANVDYGSLTDLEGVTFYTSQRAFTLNTIECTIPPGVLPIGR